MECSASAPKNNAKWPKYRFGGQVTAIHVVVIAMSLIMTIGAWQFSKSQIKTRTDARFETARDQVIGLMRNGMQKYEDALWAGVSALQSHEGEMRLEHWRVFAKSLRVDERYPGINGIGVIHVLTADTLPAYLLSRQRERPDFTVFPPHEQNVFMPISFIEPEVTNAAAVGLDVAHELNRRTAALASLDSGTAQITGPITLVQDAGHTPGFLFYAPFYADGPLESASHRRENAVGAVYAPFVVRNLMAGLLAKELRDVRFSITDAGHTIYDEHAVTDGLTDPDPMYSEQVSFMLYGREWVLDLRSNLDFRATNTFAQPAVVLLGGLIIEVLIIAMLVLMSRAHAQAVSYAQKATADLRAQSRKLALTNEELENFAYVTSHDLKTPIRGIGGLTEMLREDLDTYLRDPDAHPEVAKNLDRIQERVVRMGDLTRGIMEYSRVGDFELRSEPMSLREAMSAMGTDFTLRRDQIELNSEIEIIHADAFNLRRVLENLVGNAVKHHDGRKPLKICISIRRDIDRLRFEVADNGPGIAPQFHQRIFEVFQTLRAADAPESTGIGLSIVKKIVERQGGEIAVSSQLGAGATFLFDWPYQSANQDAQTYGKAA